MKSSMSHLLAGLIVLTFMLASPSAGWAQNNTLQVKCLDQAGQPLSGIKVFVQELQSGKMKNQDSNREGVVQLKGLESGIYRVLGRKEGFEPAYYEFVRLTGGATETVTLNFKPGDSQKKIYFEDQALTKQAYDLLLEGVQALQAQKWAEGEEKLKASLAINPSNPDAHFNLALAYIQQRKFDLVDAELNEAARLNPQEPRYQQIRAMLPLVKLGSEADTAMQQKNFELAVAKYSEMVKLQPDNADHYYNLALAQANAKHYDEATKTVDRALELKPGERAYESLKKLIAEHKERDLINQAKAIVEEGDQLYSAGQYAAALQKYEEARPLLPENVTHGLWAQLGRTHAHLNHPEQAIVAFRRAIELQPTKTEYWKALADFYLQQNQSDQALQVYADMYKQTSTPVDEGLFSLGKEFLAQEKNELAATAFQKALEANPQHAEAYYELGVYYFYDKDDKPRAKELLTKYLSLGQDQKHLDDAKAYLGVIQAQAKPARPTRKKP